MRVAVAATPDVAIPTLDFLLSSRHELVFLITRPDARAGRGKSMRASVTSEWASRHNIAIYKPQAPDEISSLVSTVDLVITIGYGVILPFEILAIPLHGFINLHFSLLPSYRGAAPVQRAMEDGIQVSGVTVFALDKGMDTGPIYVKKEIEIGEEENSGDVLKRMAKLGPFVIESAIKMIEQGISPTPQPSEGVSYAPKLAKIDGKIRWSQSAKEISAKVRAFSPKPGAWTTWREVQIELLKVRPHDNRIGIGEGKIHIDGKNVIVGCGGDTCLVLERIKASGKREMSAKEWANGARPEGGEALD